jgi:Tol biopolymer transport system component
MFKWAWSSDGKRIFYIGDGEDFYRLYSVRADGSQPRVMTRGDFDVSGFTLTVSKQTNDIFFTSSEESPYESHALQYAGTRRINAQDY